jgi:16S rRNA processing protein RimM
MLVVTSGEREELLIPFVKDFVVAVDVAGKRVEMVLPEGLLDVNR